MSNQSNGFPSGAAIVDENGQATPTWQQLFFSWHTIIQSVRDAGPTANRPTVILWIGRRYYDTTLGKPVYLKSARPAVWVDAMGTIS